MAARIPRRQPYWKSHAKGYAYVLFLCSAFSVMLIWGTKIDDDVPQHLVTNPNPITRESLPSGLPSQATKATTSDSTTYPFSPDDVVVMLKTSAATMWHRVPMHLSTSFANQTLTPNLLIYSDTATSIGGRPVIDALANASAALQASPDFEHRRALQQAARDNLDLDGTLATERRGAGQVLATALASKGVRVVSLPRAGSEDDAPPPPGRGLARLGVGERSWCEPLVGVGAVRPRDVAELDAWERGFREKHGAEVVRYKDVFAGFVGPYLVAERDEWDNFADEEHYSSSGEPGGGAGLADAEKRRRPWFSADACRSACVGEERCLQWRYADGDCYHGSEVKRGHRVKYEFRMRSGWMMERIERLMQKECRPLPRAESQDLTL
ncbi:putative glycosyltransferase family 31 protein [Neofusicoccum parvum UCRNP2]|uniref:Putative glycosyltransferase family 31 protein n=1 Tax=Botryosphaeria parva (strain UCR-NP2) TaxID=1287680 RepID=R1GID0_BOTPV|nr:putative glycosyltransferase family 31 protein [Neofusicoccum parvum UCRNP2]